MYIDRTCIPSRYTGMIARGIKESCEKQTNREQKNPLPLRLPLQLMDSERWQKKKRKEETCGKGG